MYYIKSVFKLLYITDYCSSHHHLIVMVSSDLMGVWFSVLYSTDQLVPLVGQLIMEVANKHFYKINIPVSK